MVAPRIDGNEKGVRTTSTMDGASHSVDEATMSPGRRRYRPSIGDGYSEQISRTESLPREIDSVPVSYLPVVEQKLCDPRMQKANATGAVSFLIAQDDGSEDDLSILPATVKPKKIVKPLPLTISRPGATARLLSTLIGCSDDELAG